MQQGCVFFRYSLATSITNYVKIFTDLLFYAYVGIHQVRIMVFDNFQTCPVPLIQKNQNHVNPTLPSPRAKSVVDHSTQPRFKKKSWINHRLGCPRLSIKSINSQMSTFTPLRFILGNVSLSNQVFVSE